MHNIQQQIIQKLSLIKRGRYSEIKPKNIDGNMFVYHLNLLKKDNYIDSVDKKYFLSPKGKNLIDRISFVDFKERIQPKIVTTIVIENKGKYLLYKQRRGPFIDKICFPYGKIHLEECLGDAAERELKEKSGLTSLLKHKGDVYLTVHDETELVSHMLCHIFYGNKFSGELKKDYSGGECFWGNLEDFPNKNILPGAKKILEFVKKNKKEHFFKELFLNTSDEN